MATAPDPHSTSTQHADEDFGANDWLLEEMYEQYKADPSSVDQAWVTYFTEHGAPGGAEPAAQPAAKAAPNTTPAPAAPASGANGHGATRTSSPQSTPPPAPAARRSTAAPRSGSSRATPGAAPPSTTSG